MAHFTITNLTSPEGARLNKTELGDYWDDTPFIRISYGSNGGVNFRDAIRDGDETQTPLQFVYETADCRILYKKTMAVDMTAVWKSVADSVWGGKNHCIAGNVAVNFSSVGGQGSSGSGNARRKVFGDRRASLKVSDYPVDHIHYSSHRPEYLKDFLYEVLQ